MPLTLFTCFGMWHFFRILKVQKGKICPVHSLCWNKVWATVPNFLTFLFTKMLIPFSSKPIHMSVSVFSFLTKLKGFFISILRPLVHSKSLKKPTPSEDSVVTSVIGLCRPRALAAPSQISHKKGVAEALSLSHRPFPPYWMRTMGGGWLRPN